MLESVYSGQDPSRFLEWWAQHPIILGGAEDSNCPGLAIHYIQHTNNDAFDLSILPLKVDRTEYIQSFLKQLLNDNDTQLQVSVKTEEEVLAKAVIYVDESFRWASGEGQWLSVQGKPATWTLEYSSC